MGTLAEQAVDALRVVYGRHDGYRAVHAKGVFCRGRFTASRAAAELTAAQHMQGDSVDVVARFSNGSGRPSESDASRAVRGLAVKFQLPGGATTDILAVSARRFYSRTPEDFVAFTRATAGALRPLKLLAFLVRHPESIGPLLEAVRSRPPESYATSRYNSLNSFRWIDPGGRPRSVRYRWWPVAGEAYLPLREAKRRGHEFLTAELEARLARGPVEFELRLVLASDRDPVDDANRAWPEERESVVAGLLQLTELAGDLEAGGRVLVFDPTRVVDGVELSDDPILHFRPRAYSVSVDARGQEVSEGAAAVRPRAKRAP
jgi:catalase